jgi:hypothetical protein
MLTSSTTRSEQNVGSIVGRYSWEFVVLCNWKIFDKASFTTIISVVSPKRAVCSGVVSSTSKYLSLRLATPFS